MKIHKILILSLTCLTTLHSLHAQQDYRLQQVKITPAKDQKSYTVLFLMPPHTRLGKKDPPSIAYKPRFRFHRVFIKGLTKDHFANRKRLNESKYEWDNKALPWQRLKNCCDINNGDNIDVEGDGSVMIYYNKNFSNLVIELDYSKLLAKTSEVELTELFEKLHTDIITQLGELENNAAQAYWSKTTAAEVNKKLNELLPVPQKATLSRFGAKTNSEHSFIMVSPEITLKVNVVEKISAAADGSMDKWEYRLMGTVDIPILRSNEGLVDQNPFLNFGGKSMPPNNKEVDKVLQTSTADIQLSGGIKDFKYVILYQEQFKRNNSNSKTGPSSCPTTADGNIIQCNAFLVHTDDSKKVYPFLDDGSIDSQTEIVKSAYGTRNLIIPYINIKVNGIDKPVILGTSLGQFAEKESLPSNFTLKRLYNGKYCPVNYMNDHQILLPGDIITYKP